MNFQGLFDPAQSCVKSPVIPAPFRRTLFEPVDTPFRSRMRRASCDMKAPPPCEDEIEKPKPIEDAEGRVYIRVSDVQHLITVSLRKAEKAIHKEALQNFREFLEEWQKRRAVQEAENAKPAEPTMEDPEAEMRQEPEVETKPEEEPESCNLWF